MTDTLRHTIETLLEDGSVHLVDLGLSRRGNKHLLEIFVDTETGISADELAGVSRTVDGAIEEGGLVSEPYTLVVSSPGLDRPIRFPWQYRRHKGRTVTVRYRHAGEVTDHTGEILDAEDEQLLVRDGTGIRAIPYEQIERALIVATM